VSSTVEWNDGTLQQNSSRNDIRKFIVDGFENWEEILGPMASAFRNSVHSWTLGQKLSTQVEAFTANAKSSVICEMCVPALNVISGSHLKHVRVNVII
jgi:hypothetical protein